jgi:hypothetical protein
MTKAYSLFPFVTENQHKTEKKTNSLINYTSGFPNGSLVFVI